MHSRYVPLFRAQQHVCGVLDGLIVCVHGGRATRLRAVLERAPLL